MPAQRQIGLVAQRQHFRVLAVGAAEQIEPAQRSVLVAAAQRRDREVVAAVGGGADRLDRRRHVAERLDRIRRPGIQRLACLTIALLSQLQHAGGRAQIGQPVLGKVRLRQRELPFSACEVASSQSRLADGQPLDGDLGADRAARRQVIADLLRPVEQPLLTQQPGRLQPVRRFEWRQAAIGQTPAFGDRQQFDQRAADVVELQQLARMTERGIIVVAGQIATGTGQQAVQIESEQLSAGLIADLPRLQAQALAADRADFELRHQFDRAGLADQRQLGRQLFHGTVRAPVQAQHHAQSLRAVGQRDARQPVDIAAGRQCLRVDGIEADRLQRSIVEGVLQRFDQAATEAGLAHVEVEPAARRDAALVGQHAGHGQQPMGFVLQPLRIAAGHRSTELHRRLGIDFGRRCRCRDDLVRQRRHFAGHRRSGIDRWRRCRFRQRRFGRLRRHSRCNALLGVQRLRCQQQDRKQQ